MAGISGRVAAASRLGLEDLLERKLLEEKLEEQRQQQAIDNVMREREQTFRESEAVAGREDSAAARRSAANVQGLEEMHRQRGIFEKEEGGRRLEGALQRVQDDPSIPSDYKQLFNLRQIDPKASREDIESPDARAARIAEDEDRDVRRAGRIAGAQAGAAARFREPRGAGSPQWVVGEDGAPAYRVPQPGDKPHDPVADRQQGSAGGKLSAGAIEKIAGVDTALGSAQVITDLLSTFENQLGPIAGRVAGARQMTPASDEGYAEFAAEISTLKNSMIKAITGAQMSEPEAKRIMTQVPDTTNQPPVFRARLATTIRNLEMLKRRTMELSGVSGGDGRSEPRMTPSHGGAAPKDNDPLGIRRPPK